MKITTREEKISTTINYNDGCTKTIQHFKVYLGHMKTPTFKYKIVDFRYPDGEIDEDRSYDRKIIDDDTDEEFTDTESDSESKSGSEEESEEESGEESEEETNTSLISVSNSEEQFVLPEPKVDISKRKKYTSTAKMIKFRGLDMKTKQSFIDIRKTFITHLITNKLNNSKTIKIDKKMNSVLGIRENTTIDISDLDNIAMQFYS